MNLSVPAVLPHDPLRRIGCQTCTRTYSLRRKERFKDIGHDFRSVPRSVVADLNHRTFVLAVGSDSKLGFAVHNLRFYSMNCFWKMSITQGCFLDTELAVWMQKPG
jgi:hypothetical protein